MLDPKKVALFAKIISLGGTVVCNAKTRDRLHAAARKAGNLDSPLLTVRFRLSPHMRDGQVAAITHDSHSQPQELTDRTPSTGTGTDADR